MDVQAQAKEVRRQPVVGHSPVTSLREVYFVFMAGMV